MKPLRFYLLKVFKSNFCQQSSREMAKWWWKTSGRKDRRGSILYYTVEVNVNWNKYFFFIFNKNNIFHEKFMNGKFKWRCGIFNIFFSLLFFLWNIVIYFLLVYSDVWKPTGFCFVVGSLHMFVWGSWELGVILGLLLGIWNLSKRFLLNI